MSKRNVTELMESMRLQFGGDEQKATDTLSTPVIEEAHTLLEELPPNESDKVSVFDHADKILARIGHKLPELEERPRITAAILWEAAENGVFGKDIKAAWKKLDDESEDMIDG